MATLQESLDLVNQIKSDNPGLQHLNDQEVADMVHEQTGDERMLPAARSSPISRGIVQSDEFFRGLGQKAEKSIVDDQSSFPTRIAGRIAGNTVSSLPEMALMYLGGRFGGVGQTVATTAGAAYDYGKTKAETGDEKAALGAGAGFILNALGGAKGSKLGRRLAGEPEQLAAGQTLPKFGSPEAIKRLAGGVAGATIGQVPGDYLSAVTAPGETWDLSKLREDPVNLPAYLLGQPITGAVLDAAGEAHAARKQKIEANKLTTPDMSELMQESAASELARLNATPVAERNEIMKARMRELSGRLNELDELQLKDKTSKLNNVTPQGISELPEAPATLQEQIRSLNQQKRPAVEIAKGQELPEINPWDEGFKSHEGSNGKLYLYDERQTNPEKIEDAIKTNTLGNILGYGVPNLPQNPNGKLVVLRNRKGVEKASVVVDDATTQAAISGLQKQALGDDRISIEPVADVLAWRLKNKGLKNLFSLDTQAEDQRGADIHFGNSVLDMLNSSMQPKITGIREKGPRFQPDSEGMISGEGLLKAIKQWAPGDLYAHYKDRGLEEFLGMPKHQYTVQEPIDLGNGRIAPGYHQIDPMEAVAKGGKAPGRMEPLTKEEQAALPKPPSNLKTGQYVLRNGEFVRQHKTLLAANKVPVEALAQWLRKNTPEIEVKKLAPELPENPNYEEASRLQHELANHGYEVSDQYGDTRILDREGNHIEFESLSSQVKDLLLRYEKAITQSYPETDAATGRYGVEPIHVNEMDQPVDMLIRSPTKEDFLAKKQLGKSQPDPDSVLFRGPHFGRSDVNVLASIRGYFHKLANGEKAFFPFEIQSDWGQAKAKAEARVPIGLKRKPLEMFDHPLLDSYETLAIKAAIQHAKANGATKIILPDAKTAMMIEGHDRLAETEVNQIRANAGEKVNIKQEAGMTSHYDGSLPSIAQRLTGDKGRAVDLGEFTARGPSYYFGGKKNITGRAYDITNVKPEVHNLFKLYDAEQQGSFERNLTKLSEQIHKAEKYGETVTEQQILERSIQGDRSANTAALVKFLDTIKGTRGILREGNLPERVAGHTNTQNNNIIVNKANRMKVEQAFGNLAHELTHGAVADMKMTDPRSYEYGKQYVENLGVEGRKAIFDQLKRTPGLESLDSSYLSGEHFNPNDPFYGERVMHEFMAGVTEAVAKAHFSNESHPEWMNTLPQPVIKVLKKVLDSIKQFFGDKSPSISNMLDKGQSENLNRVIDIMQKHVIDVQDANIRAYLKIKNSQAFDPASFLQDLPHREQLARDSILNTRGGEGSLFNFAKQGAEDSYAIKKKGKLAKLYEDNWFSPLFRTRTRPETADFFWALHGMRPAIQAEENGYHAYLGQKPDGSLSREQAFERWNKFSGKMLSPFNSRRTKFLDAFSKINEENQNIREKLPNTTDDDLVSTKQMVEKYGMTPEEAEYTKRIIKMSELVAQESLRKSQVVDATEVSKLFYRQNKDQSIPEVKDKIARITRITNDAGVQRFENEQYKKQLDELSKVPDADPKTVAELQKRVANLDQQEQAFKQLLDQNIRQEFGDKIPFDPNPGADPFINSASELMLKLAALRAKQSFITKDAGYAPMTRRGRFLLRVYKDSELGSEFAKVKEFRGFETEKEARDYIAKEKLPEDSFELMDKDSFRDRARIASPDRLKSVRDDAKAQMDSLIAELKSKTGLMDEVTKNNFIEAYDNVQRNFAPLDEEIKNVLAVRGDKFKERRYLVPGFDRNDFLPNIFEYMNYKSVAGNKAAARAEAELQMEHKNIDPELRKQMQTETDYTLGNQSDWSKLRKLTFYYYLGASLRHVVQNAVQIPMNGISQMTAEGHGLDSYKYFTKAAKMSAQYAHRGTTGDKVVDSLMKQAEKDGVSVASVLEAPTHDSVEIQNAIDSMTSSSEGSTGFGEKVSHVGTAALKGVEKFLMSTSKAAERANRQTTFMASIVADRAKGITDPAKLYQNAVRFTNYVNFVGDKANRPGFITKSGNSPMHAPLMLWSALQSFTINHISQLYSFYEKGLKQGSAPDKKAFAVGLAHLLAFSGGMGFIGAQTAEQIFEQLTGVSLTTAIRKGIVTHMSSWLGGDDDEKKKKWASVGDRVADTALYGFPAAFGVDSSQSIGLGSPFMRYQAGGPPELGDIAGAGYGMLGRVATAVGDVSKDPFNPKQWMQAGRDAAPSALSQALRVYDVMNAGTAVDSKKQPIGDPLGMEGSAAAMLGFTPMQVSKERQFNSQVYKQTKRQAEEYDIHTRNIAQGIADFQKSGDPQDLLAANSEFSKYVDSVGGLQDRDSMVDSITEQLQEFQGKVTRPASLKGSAERQSLEAAFPSVTSRYPSAVAQTLAELEVAQLLGQEDVLLRKAQSLPSSIRDKVLHDALISAGVRPEEVSPVLRPGSSAHLGPSGPP